MKTSHFDAVIVGGGPAGAAAAYDLAVAGRSVLILDRVEFPRQKACAGALTMKAVNALRYSVEPVVRRVCTSLALGRRFEKRNLFSGRHPICVMTVRAELDEFCLNQALNARAQFEIVSRVSKITTTSSRVEVETSSGTVTASFVIGADGVNSVVRTLSDQFHEMQTGLAVEACIPWSSDTMPPMEFDFGIVEAGYGWVFPKHDHVNVGLYTNLAGLPLTRAALREYALKRLGRNDIGGFIGQKIGLNGAAYRPTSARVFLVGDAAGFVDPLLGEGIYNAIKSGQAAAAAVAVGLTSADTALGAFEAGLRPIRKDAASCAHSADRFYRDLRLGYRALISTVPKYALMKGFAAGKTFHFTKRFVFLLPFIPVRSRIRVPVGVNAAGQTP